MTACHRFLGDRNRSFWGTDWFSQNPQWPTSMSEAKPSADHNGVSLFRLCEWEGNGPCQLRRCTQGLLRQRMTDMCIKDVWESKKILTSFTSRCLSFLFFLSLPKRKKNQKSFLSWSKTCLLIIFAPFNQNMLELGRKFSGAPKRNSNSKKLQHFGTFSQKPTINSGPAFEPNKSDWE